MNVTAVCERSGGWWAVSVPEVKGAHTQARRLDQVPAMVADAVSLLDGIPAEDVHVTLDVRVPGEALKEWAEARRLAAQARQLQEESAARARAAVAELQAEGLTVRDIGALLDISAQRVSQLAHA